MFFLIFIFIIFGSSFYESKIVIQSGNLDVSKNFTFNKNIEYIIVFNYNQTIDNNTYLRAYITGYMEYSRSVLIIFKDGKDQVSYMKLSNYGNVSSVKGERTICPSLDILYSGLFKERTLQVEISTESVKDVIVTIAVYVMNDLILQVNERRTVSIDILSPKYFLFKFDESDPQVNVKLISSNSTCMILSIQPASCPVNDLIENVKYKGMYQTVIFRGSIIASPFTIEVNSLRSKSFFVVFVVTPNEVECLRNLSNINPIGSPNYRRKDFDVIIEQIPASIDYIKPILLMIGFYLLFFLITGFTSLIYKRCFKQESPFNLEDVSIINSPMVDPASCPTVDEVADMETIYSRKNPNVYGTYDCETENSSTISRVRTIDSDDASYDSLSDATTDPNIYRLNTSLFVSDLSKKHSALVNRKYFLYLWYLVIISFFYGLPVVQLVITYQQVVRNTGNQDVCYYNFQCTRPFYIFMAFNNIVSNLGYVLLGILFTLITWRRHSLYNECRYRILNRNTNQGIPQYYGLFYAMGLALTMEGILSACYHICPSNNNFQFDTAYMYILACLCMIKLYQTRHPDVNASAHSFYMTMSFIIFMGVIGVVYNTLLFWIFFTIIYIAICVLLTLEVYYVGRWRFDIGLPRRAYNVILKDKWMVILPVYKTRMIVLSVLNVINLSFALYGGFHQPSDFASYFLAIFMLNLLLYFVFYVIMKMKNCENFHVLPIIYVIVAIVCWAFAIYCFIYHPTDWQLTPAESRQLNQDCMFLDFYDLHDVWHFLSSMSMFFSFLALQNLDDSLFSVDREKIPVF